MSLPDDVRAGGGGLSAGAGGINKAILFLPGGVGLALICRSA
jgi:hypothetical protein